MMFQSKRPCVTFGVAADDGAAEEIWPLLEKGYLEIAEQPIIRSADFAAPHRPATTPWCSSIVLFAKPEELDWIEDFGKRLAWAFLDTMK
jgi:hypothetical protein